MIFVWGAYTQIIWYRNWIGIEQGQTGGDGGGGGGMVLFFNVFYPPPFMRKLHAKITLDCVLLDTYIK